MFKNNAFLKKTLIFLSVLGPSVITTMAGNDGAGVITYSYAGAVLGYGALITLPILTLLYAVTQEMGSRAAIVTGKGLGDLIRERFGVKTAAFVFVALLLANFGTLLTDMASLKTAGDMLGLPEIPFLIITVALCFILVTFTKYEKSQKVFLTGIVVYLVYVFSALKASPHWADSFKSLVIPQENIFSKEFLFISVAVLGTTITPWGQFFVQSYMKDKNVSIGNLLYSKAEAFFGAIISNLFTFFIIVATAATLFVHNIPLDSGEKAALAIRPFVGNFAGVLFALGLINAAVIGIIIVSLTSAYAFSEFFGFTGSLDEPLRKGKSFYGLFLVNIVLAGILVMTPWFPLFKIVIYTQSVNGILLPVFFYFLIKIMNDKELMGEYINGKLNNIFAVAATVIIAIAGIAAVFVSFIH